MKSIVFSPSPKAAVCFIALLLVNLGGTLWAFFSVRFIATTTSVVVGAVYAALSFALIWASVRRIGTTRKAAAFIAAVVSIFGLFAVGQGAASAYTNVLGASAIKNYTISSSYQVNGGRRQGCNGYESQMSGVLWLAVSVDLLCTESPLAIGSTVVVTGRVSPFGQVATHIEFANGP